jgi:hypothetical protein
MPEIVATTEPQVVVKLKNSFHFKKFRCFSYHEDRISKILEKIRLWAYLLGNLGGTLGSFWGFFVLTFAKKSNEKTILGMK